MSPLRNVIESLRDASPVRPPGPGRLSLLLGVLTASIWMFPPTGPALAAPPEELKLEQFLNRLGLTDLQVLQLERMVEQETQNEVQRRELARRLADLYATQLMAAADDADRYDRIMAKIDTLTARVPEAKTAALGVILLQADYNRAEKLVAKWIADPKETQARQEAGQILRRITPELTTRRGELKKQVDSLIAALDELETADREFELKEQQLGRLQAVAGRASYFAAWSNYYSGLLQDVGGKTQLNTAREIFRDVLGIDTEYDKVEADWLALESIWRSRSLIGLGLTEAALGNLTGSAACFDLLQHASVSPEIQDQAPYWRLRGLLNAGQLDQALAYAGSQIKNFNGRATQGKVSLCVALVRAGYATSDPTPTETSLGRLGVTGLAKLGQQKALGQLVEQLSISLDEPEGFFLNWIKGRQLSEQARADKDPEKYQAAAEAMERALAADDARTNALQAANCRYELGWCYFQLEKYEAAGRAYEQAVIGLKAAKEASAADAAWMAFVSYNKLAESNRRFASLAIDVLRGLKNDFPTHRYAKKADYFIAKLQRSGGSTADAIRDLMAIKPNDPNYLSARYDLCVLLHQEWKENPSTARADRLNEAVDQFAGEAKDPRRRLRALLMSADVAASAKPPQWSKVEQRLNAAANSLEQVASSDALAAEYHYRRLQLASQRNNDTARRAEATWLVENAADSAYALPALVITARGLEQRLKSGAADAALRNELIDIYRRLSRRYGTTAATLKENKNARVAASRLAEHLLLEGRAAEAADVLSKLLAAFPKDADFTRRAAMARFQAGDFQQSLEHWRVLVRGLRAGGAEWCEAKYHQIACLAKLDREAAVKSMRQFKLLYPNLGHESYRTRFQRLASTLGV